MFAKASEKRFRKELNVAMFISAMGTLPYVFSGGSRYQREVLGTLALALVIYHCIVNRYWFRQIVRNRNDNGKKNQFKLLYNVNIILIIVTFALLISSIMISGYVFGFLHIPYLEFWHYIHLLSGVAFILLVFVHLGLHVR